MLIVNQLVKEVSVIHWTRKFITVFTTAFESIPSQLKYFSTYP